MSKKPTPREIKENNTARVAELIDTIGVKLGLKPSTLAGACMSVYVNTMLQQAATEDIAVVRRNLDRAIEMLQAMRSGVNADEMETLAMKLAGKHSADVHKRDSE
jgi:hypothetical protein